MIQIVWQFEVKEDSQSMFELAYGPGGAWGELFAKCPGFRGTALLRDTKNPRRYLTIDSWDTEAQREAMLAEHGDKYRALDARFREWTIHEAEVGVYRILAEALVRPSISERRGKSGLSRRNTRRGG
jgi:heme-degrading monooxygenase HmoA